MFDEVIQRGLCSHSWQKVHQFHNRAKDYSYSALSNILAVVKCGSVLRPCIFYTWDVRLANTRRRRADETPILSLWQPLSTAGHRCHQGRVPITSIAWSISKLWEKSRFACWKSCPCPGRRLMSGFIPGSPAMDPATLVGGGDCNAHSSARNVDTRVRTIHGLLIPCCVSLFTINLLLDHKRSDAFGFRATIFDRIQIHMTLIKQ